MVDTRLRTSFVPKKTLMAKDDRLATPSVNIILSIGTIIFFMTLAVAAGVLLYKLYVDKTVAGEKVQLEQAQKAFDPAIILDMKMLDERLITAKEILETHFTVLPIFKLLSDSTLQSVQLTNFKMSASRGGAMNVSVSGVAKRYPSVVNQTDAFAAQTGFKNASLSGVTLEDDGSIKFNMTTDIDPSLVLYRSIVAALVPDTTASAEPSVQSGPAVPAGVVSGAKGPFGI